MAVLQYRAGLLSLSLLLAALRQTVEIFIPLRPVPLGNENIEAIIPVQIALNAFYINCNIEAFY